MKVGQLLSLDAGDLLPPEFSVILARLRADAQPMPHRQLAAVLVANYGVDWRKRFATFEPVPIAAASIGQVHRARTRDGRDLAIKVQYSGVRTSIDSDVGNVATLLRLSGLLPATLDIAPLLDEARRQLREEADYAAEARALIQFGALLDGSPDFVVPDFHADLSTGDVLAMSYVEGSAIESLEQAPQATRDRTATLLIGLTLREIFAFGVMQTDPNFANYRWQSSSGRVVLLDFGATRAFPDGMADKYAGLARAVLAGDREGIADAAIRIGYFDGDTAAHHREGVVDLIAIAGEPLRRDGVYDFADGDLAIRLRDRGMAFAAARDFWHIPPVDALFLQRKIGGMYLLASRLRARVDVGRLLAEHGIG